MQTRRTPTRHDVFELMQRIAENPKNKEEVPATTTIRDWYDPLLDQIGNILEYSPILDEIRIGLEDPENEKEVASEKELEQILQKLSYEMVNGEPTFNKDPGETQEELLLARKMFEWSLEKKITSSDLDGKSKNRLLGLLKNNNYKGLLKSINEELKNINKTKANRFMVDITSLAIGIGHLLDRLKSGLFSQKLPTKPKKEEAVDLTSTPLPPPLPQTEEHVTITEDTEEKTPIAPPPPRRPTSTGDLKAAMSIPAIPSRDAPPPPPVARPLKGPAAARPPKPATTTPPAPVQKQVRPLPAKPPVTPKGSVEGSVRSKSDFFEQLAQRQSTPREPTVRTPHKLK